MWATCGPHVAIVWCHHKEVSIVMLHCGRLFLSVCLILTVMFELEVDTLHFYSRLAAIQWAVDTNLGTESVLCQTHWSDYYLETGTWI